MTTEQGMRKASLSHLGIVRVTGPQCFAFLQGQFTCDLKEVTETQSRLGAHCNFKGRILTTFRLIYTGTCYYLILPATMVGFLLKDLKQYAVFYKVKLEDVSHTTQKVGLIGEEWAPCIGSVAEHIVDEESVYTDAQATYLRIPGIIPRVLVIHSVETLLPKTTPLDDSLSTLWNTVDIKSGIASVVPETRRLFTPHQLNYHLKKGIGFAKGCYTGQEVIARMHYLGKLKQGLYLLCLTNARGFDAGADIKNAAGQIEGTLVTEVLNPEDGAVSDNKKYALSVVQHSAVTSPLYIANVVVTAVTACIQ